MRPSITHFTSDGAVFDDGHFEDFDTVVMATGYEYKFPFLDDKVGLTYVLILTKFSRFSKNNLVYVIKKNPLLKMVIVFRLSTMEHRQ